MRLVVGVKDFGKISEAEVALADLVVFVGNNNSGKTMMMQLVYGVMEYILNESGKYENGLIVNDDKSIIFDIDWFKSWERHLNSLLSNKKDKLITDIFHRKINIDQLYVRFEDIVGKYKATYEEIINEKAVDSVNGEVSVLQHKRSSYVISYQDHIKTENVGKIIFGKIYSIDIIKRIVIDRIQELVINGTEQLFFPASRTGIQLLYKYFFAERDKKIMEEIEFHNSDIVRKNVYGLTDPVYDFLQFLQKYTRDIEMEKRNKKLLQFIEDKMIDGKIMQESDETFYQEINSKEQVPMYLASALVNEMAPMVKALTSGVNYKRYYWDEVETCIHPLKQGELARFIIRMVNNGRKMLISTHSDTMACKINNLLVLSALEDSERQNEKIQRLGLSKADLLNGSSVKVYQFVNDEHGSSKVNELEFKSNPQTGYDFHLFMKSLDELYKETEIIME